MGIAILYRKELQEYDFGSGHPFRGDRYEIFLPFLKSRLSEDNYYRILEAEPASEEDLLRICDRDYIHFNQEYYQAVYAGWSYYYENFRYFQSIDNKPIGTPGRLEEAARLIVGQAKMACDLIQSDKYQKVVSIGGGMHHAKRRYGEGFCIYNDIAFTTTYLIDNYNLDRILVLDTDAHAGNGTAEYLCDNPKILFIDIHQDPRTIYPGTGFVQEIGIGDARGFTFNIPLPVYAGYDSYKLIFDEIIHPVTREFKPQIIIRNGGSDPHFNDGLTYLGLPITGFKMIGDEVRKMTEICHGREIDLIASGYNKKVLPYAWLALLAGIGDLPIPLEEPESIPPKFQKDLVLDETQQVLEDVKKYHRDRWKCFQ